MSGSDARGWPGSDIDTPAPPHSLDLDAIVRAGRRQVRHRRMARVGGAAAGLAALAAIPATVPLWPSGGSGTGGGPPPAFTCDLSVLPLPGEYATPAPGIFASIAVASMDPTGRFVVANARHRILGAQGSIEGSAAEVPSEDEVVPGGVILWDDGRPTMPAALRGDHTAYDVNADGVVVGVQDSAASSDVNSWIYRDGEVSPLPAPDGHGPAEATAVNAVGDVMGWATAADGSRSLVVWPVDDVDNPRVLVAPPGRELYARGITDGGIVVGDYYEDHGSARRAETGVYLWEPGRAPVELPVPEWPHDDVYVAAVGGNWAVGEAYIEPDSPADPVTGTTVIVRWDLSTHEYVQMPDLSGVGREIWAVNAAGDILFNEQPGLIRGGEVYDLPDPVNEGAVTPPHTEYPPRVWAHSISDDGATIAGVVQFSVLPEPPITPQSHPVLWHC